MDLSKHNKISFPLYLISIAPTLASRFAPTADFSPLFITNNSKSSIYSSSGCPSFDDAILTARSCEIANAAVPHTTAALLRVVDPRSDLTSACLSGIHRFQLKCGSEWRVWRKRLECKVGFYRGL
jgi:hypothetical protein